MGTDGLRLWAATIDFSSDAVVSDTLVNNVQEVFRKIRNTCRFLVSNLYDFALQKDAVAIAELSMIDQCALYELRKFNEAVIKAYKHSDLSNVQHLFADY